MLAMLAGEDWAAMSSCSRQLRHLIHSSVTTTAVKTVGNVQAVLTGYWPQLALIKLQPKASSGSSEHLCLPVKSNFQLLATLELRIRGYWVRDTAFVVSTRSWQA